MSASASTATSPDLIRTKSENENLQLEPSSGFVSTPQIAHVVERALAYLQAGFPVHFAGPAGTGKTTLAFHVAAQLARPVTLIHGDDEFGSADLIGRDSGYRRSTLVDNFIHSVVKTQDEVKSYWVDSRLTMACRDGNTLIYDEFNRSPAEANNALLSVLSERILNLPKLRRSGEGYMNVHPEFHAIFTSNPEEYAGVHKTQDALLDRMITIDLGHYDRETEIAVTMAKSGIELEDATSIINIIDELRALGNDQTYPTIRAAIAIARVIAARDSHARINDELFRWVCRDVLSRDGGKGEKASKTITPKTVDVLIHKFCR